MNFFNLLQNQCFRLTQSGDQTSKQELLTDRFEAAQPSIEFFVLLVIATILATAGLISNSAAVVIGAMILAPLMDPIISLAFGIAVANKGLIIRSSCLIALGVGVTVGISALMSSWLLVAYVDGQILSRTNPNLLEMIVAVASGIVAAFAHSRYKLVSSVAGIAVAVALVPPLCVTGIGINQSELISARFSNVLVTSLTHRLASGSFLLFITNLIGIAGAAAIVFIFQRYGSIRKSCMFGGIWLSMLLIISSPLASNLRNYTVERNIEANFRQFKSQQITRLAIAKEDRVFWSTAIISYINTEIEKNELSIDLVVEGQVVGDTEAILTRAYKHLKNEIKREGDYTINARINFIPIRTFAFEDRSEQSKVD